VLKPRIRRVALSTTLGGPLHYEWCCRSKPAVDVPEFAGYGRTPLLAYAAWDRQYTTHLWWLNQQAKREWLQQQNRAAGQTLRKMFARLRVS
jgi:hypothetical protein